jgi:CDGSH-type Zn-finger protein
MIPEVKQYKCRCGRSPTGYCVGLHDMTNEQYKKYLAEQQKTLNEQSKPQFLVD